MALRLPSVSTLAGRAIILEVRRLLFPSFSSQLFFERLPAFQADVIFLVTNSLQNAVSNCVAEIAFFHISPRFPSPDPPRDLFPERLPPFFMGFYLSGSLSIGTTCVFARA